MKRFEKQAVLINGFGAFGYFILLLTWALFAAVVIMGLLNASVLQVPALDSVQVDAGRPEPSGALAASAYVVTGVMAIVSLAVVIVLPYLVGHWGSRLTRLLLRAAKSPLGHRSLFSTKLLLLLAASLGMFISGFFLPPENSEVYAVQLFGSVCAVVAIVLFMTQHILAKRLKIAIEKVW